MDEERTITVIDRRTQTPVGKIVRFLELTGAGETLRYKARPGWRALTLDGRDCGCFRTRKEAIAAIDSPLPTRPSSGQLDYLAAFSA